MIQTPMDVLHRFPVRKSKKQKQAFRDEIQSYAEKLGYKTRMEKFNLVIGDPETVPYIITTACNNDSGVVTLLEIAASIPRNLRDRVCFVLLNGKHTGASLHYRKHRCACSLQTVMHLDQLGNGDHIMLIPNKMLRTDEQKLNPLIELERRCGSKCVRVWDTGLGCLLAGALPFTSYIIIRSMHKNRLFYYPAMIPGNTPDYTNVNILRACLISYIGGASGE